MYTERLTAVKNFGLFMWLEDEVLVPKESEWFGYWNDKRDTELMKQQ